MSQLGHTSVIPIRFVFLLWLVHIVELSLGISFADFGIIPRTIWGMIGILTAPLIHGNLMHLLSNTITLLVLGIALFWIYPGAARAVFFYCYFITGFLVWLFGRPSIHIGASGLLYGIALFLMTIGLFRKDPKSIFVSILVVFFYSSILWGVLPIDPMISFESHLMGALVGIGCASGFSRSKYLY